MDMAENVNTQLKLLREMGSSISILYVEDENELREAMVHYLGKLFHDVRSYENGEEGFIRQIIGWREFMFSLYKRLGRRQRTSNFFGFERTLSDQMKNGTSGIVPLDRINTKVLETSYSHHIERLMVQGNLFLLTETAPDAVYRYFMSHYIDAYDWVMVGNVYGMSQYADGGLITTKPYISSSNYLHKMSYYPKNQGWSKLWDALYWRFMFRYSDRFATNPRMKMQRSLLEKMSPNVLREHCNVGDEFIQRLSEF